MAKIKIPKKQQAQLEEKQVALSEAALITKAEKEHVGFKNGIRTIGKALKYGKPFHAYLWISIIAVLVSAFFELLIPVYTGKCIDNIISTGNVDFKNLLKTALLLVLFVSLSTVFNWIQNIATNRYCFKSAAHLRKGFFGKINSLPLKVIDQSTHGDLLSRMTNDIELLTDGFLEGLSTITNGVITIIGTLIFMFILNVPLALVVICLTPLSMIISFYIAKKSYKLFATQVRNEGEISGHLEEFISGGRVVKAFNYEKQSIDDFDKINERYNTSSEKAGFFSSLANPATRIINSIVYVAVGFVGAWLAIKGHAGITIGLISSFLSYANSFGRPFNELSTEITEFQAAFAAGERIFAILDAEDEPSDALLPEVKRCTGAMEVKEAYFSYTPKQKLIQNFNLKVEPGQKIAIVGPTGCGKTTLINLLMRFYDLNSGTIMMNNQKITDVKRESWRNKFGMVLQESWMFGATIRDNIAYGNPKASLRQVIKAAKLAGAHDFISKMPKGYDSIVSEGGNNLSQGQKQLICIARIMLIKPKMLILDEATSNIDTRTEQKIQQAFNTIMEGRTTFIVAHRLSTIVNADRILVMNKGNVIEQGTHEELLGKHGFYYNLYNSQFAKTDE